MCTVIDLSGSVSTVPGVLLRDATDGQDIDQVLMVRAAAARTTKSGGSFVKLTLGDRTAGVPANVWEDVDADRALCIAGTPVHVRGRYEVHAKWGAQLRVTQLAAADPGSYDERDLLDGPPRTVEQMERDLAELVATVQVGHLRELLDLLLGAATPTGQAFRRAPAAKHYHQAYPHGLLEHCLTVAQAVGAISATFPGIDRDVAVTGALLHDIGKLEAYTSDSPAIDLTDDGRLQGEIPLGYYLVRRTIEALPGFPAALAQSLLHIILSHHGSLEHGSPVVPQTREATLVHMIDNLGGRLGSFDRLQKQLSPGAQWSGFDRAISGGAFFGAALPDDARAAA